MQEKNYAKVSLQKILCGMLLALAFSVQMHAQDCMLLPMALQERVQASPLIVEGEVISQQSFWSLGHKTIYTLNKVKVYKRFKGAATAGTIDVITEGGTVGMERIVHSSTLSLTVGEMGVMLLIPNPYTDSGISGYTPYGSLAGFVRYEPDGSAHDPYSTYEKIEVNLHQAIKSITNLPVIKVANNPKLKAILNKTVGATGNTGKTIGSGNSVQATPTITGFSPTSVASGIASTITITGTNFGATRGTGGVEFRNADDGGATWIRPLSADYVSWSNTQIVVKVPSTNASGNGAGTGQIRVVNSDATANTATSSGTLTVTYGYLNLTYNNVARMATHIKDNASGGYTFVLDQSSGFAAATGAVSKLAVVMDRWTCASGINWLVGGNTTGSVANDGVNIACFSAGLPASVLARCTSYYSGCGVTPFDWYVSEIDVAVKSNLSSGFSWYYGTGTPSASEYDFETVMLHEIGHGHQLGHVIDATAVMHYAVGAGQTKRTLNANDIAGSNYIKNRDLSVGGICGNQAMTVLSCGAGTSAPVVNFSANRTNITVGCQVTFTSEAVPQATSWSWNFNGGATNSTLENPTVTFNTPGTYTVSLTATNANGSNTSTRTNYIVVSALACSATNTNWVGSNADYNAPGSGKLIGHNAAGDLAFADKFLYCGTSTKLTQLKYYFNLSSGTGNITAKVWNADGAGGSPGTALFTQTVPIASLPDFATPTTVDIPGGLMLSGDYFIGFEIAYAGSDAVSLISNLQGESTVSSAWRKSSAGVWDSFLSIYGSSLSLRIEGVINNAPTATITAGGATTFCSGNNVMLNANTGTGLTYMWFRNGSPLGISTSNYQATVGGNYTVEVTYAGCSTTSSATTVTVNTAPTATITPNGSTTFCNGNSVMLNANTGSGLSYIWYRDGSPLGVTAASYQALVSGTYTVQVTATATACSTLSSGVAVTVNPTPTATITPNGPTTFCAGGSVTFNANTGSGLSYIWYRDGSPLGVTTSSYQATTSGNYAVQVTATATACSTLSPEVFVTVNTCVSSNANLANLSLSSGTLNPVFAQAITSYTASVPNSVSSITVTPTAADANALIRVNTLITNSGSPSSSIPLNVGSNTITVLVRAQDNTTTKTYTVTVTRAPSSNANLSDLTIPGGFNETFATNTTAYTVTLPYANTSTTVTPTVADPTATVTVNSVAVTSGSPSGAIALNVGTNLITVVVTAQDGTTKTYTITVTRQPSANANLSNLTVSAGALSPAFAPFTFGYSISVPNATTSTTITPTVADATATVTVNSISVTSGSPSGAIVLNVGQNAITVVVTAQNGSTQTYTVTITRRPSATLTGTQTICQGNTAWLTVTMTGTPPFSFTFSDGSSTATFNGVTENPLLFDVGPASTRTYTLTAFSDANGAAQAGDLSSNAVVTVVSSVVYYADADGDGYGNPAVAQASCSGPPTISGHVAVTDNTDCNDNDATMHASYPFYVDNDHDGYGMMASPVNVCAASATQPPFGYALSASDCDDSNASIYRYGNFYVDSDGDGYAAGNNTITICYGAATPPGLTTTFLGTDCNDSDSTVFWGESVFVDQDGDGYTNGSVNLCHGATLPTGYTRDSLGPDCDDNDATIHASYPFYVDNDHDGYGMMAGPVNVCAVSATQPPVGYSLFANDCDDSNASVYRYGNLYYDQDGDGYSPGNTTITVCYGATPPPGLTASFLGFDCNDSDATVFMTENVYVDADGDGYDGGTVNLCHGAMLPAGYSHNSLGADCDDSDGNLNQQYPFYVDSDQDGYGTGSPVSVCAFNATTPPLGYSHNNTDCDDSDPVAHESTLFFIDADGDSIGGTTGVFLCGSLVSPPAGYSAINTDCDDSDSTVYRYGFLYVDLDGDGYTNGQQGTCYGIDAPLGYSLSSLGGDCDDSDGDVYRTGNFYVDQDGDGYDAGTIDICYGATVPPGYSATTLGSDCDDSDGAAFQTVTLYVDNDGDGYDSGSIDVCAGAAVPPGYSTTTDGPDCDDSNAATHESFLFYFDNDGDGYGAGSPEMVCAVDADTPPANYSIDGNDCSDNDTSVYRTVELHVDNDGDGYDNGLTQTLCIGATAPLGFVEFTLGPDCDDSDATAFQYATVYIDMDSDGYDAGTSDQCFGATPPAGYSLTTLGIDCNDNDASSHDALMLYVDEDGDGYGNDALPTIQGCGTTPGYAFVGGDCNDQIAAIHPGQTEVLYNGVDDNCDGDLDGANKLTTSLLSAYCNVTLTALNSTIGITTISAYGHNITGYRIKAVNGANTQIIERTVPNFTMGVFPTHDYATTYTISIELQRAGVWLGYYGPTCQVSTPAILANGGAAAVNPSQCGITLAKINTLIATTSIPNVTGYRFRITNLTDLTGPNQVQVLDRTQNWFGLQMLARYNYGTTYRIEVAVKTTGTYGGYGAACEVSSPAAPGLTNCGGLLLSSNTQTITTASLSGVTQYRFQLTRLQDNATASIDRAYNWFNANMIPASIYTAGAVYGVRIAVMTTNTWSPYGDACEITLPGVANKADGSGGTLTDADFRAVATPNPFTADFNITLVGGSREAVNLKVYDMLGKLIDDRNVLFESLDGERLGAHYPAGVYNVIVTQGERVRSVRIIKR